MSAEEDEFYRLGQELQAYSFSEEDAVIKDYWQQRRDCFDNTSEEDKETWLLEENMGLKAIIDNLKKNKKLFNDIKNKVSAYKSPYWPPEQNDAAGPTRGGRPAIILLGFIFIAALINMIIKVCQAAGKVEKAGKIERALLGLSFVERQKTNILYADSVGCKSLQDALNWHRDGSKRALPDAKRPDTSTFFSLKKLYPEPKKFADKRSYSTGLNKNAK